jgi:hypothetical protein
VIACDQVGEAVFWVGEHVLNNSCQVLNTSLELKSSNLQRLLTDESEHLPGELGRVKGLRLVVW